MKFTFFFFGAVFHAFVVISKNPLPNPSLWRFILCFPVRKVLSALIFRCWFIWSWFLYMVWSKGLATSFACGHPAHLLKTILSPWNSFGNLVKSQLTMDVWDISRILILFHSPITCLHVSTVLTWLLSILGSFETGKCESFSFVLTLHAVLTPNCEQLYVNKP